MRESRKWLIQRITALLQKTNDKYASDIFLPLINKSIDLTNSEKSIKSASHRVIADHLRSSALNTTIAFSVNISTSSFQEAILHVGLGFRW